MYKLLLYVILLLFCQCKRDHSLKEEVTDLLRTEIVIRGDKALAEEPVTITAYRAARERLAREKMAKVIQKRIRNKDESKEESKNGRKAESTAGREVKRKVLKKGVG